MMMRRRFVNLVTINWTECAYSVRRMDPYKHLFYQSANAAIEAAAAADEAPAMEEGRRRRLQPLQLPHSQMNFAATDCGGILDTFAIFRPRCGEEEEGRIVYFSKFGEAGLYDGDKHLHHTLGVLNAPKGISPMCLSMAPHPAAAATNQQDSMYVLSRWPGKDNGRCFEVLEPLPNPTVLSSNMVTPNWRWRLLPPPPFISQHGYRSTPITAYTTAVSNGCSTIYVSFNGGIGTYRFEAARPDPSSHLGWSPSEEWGYLGPWRLPFHGRAHYVPQFNLWLGFSEFSPSHLCAVDLSAIATDGGEGGLPTVLQVHLDLPDREHWIPVNLELVNLGDGKFLIARIFEIEATSEQFAVLTGIEMMMMMADDQSLKVVKHKCVRYDFGDDSINWVL